MKHLLSLRIFFSSCLIVSLLQLAVGCANIVPPSGGPRDTLAPYLVIAKPKDSSLQVQPKEILIGFNEYITTDALQDNFIISPSIKTTPLIDFKLNAVRIRINDSLAPNTTYSLNFGNGIKDVNEGNIARNFTYVFSTGNHIDSGRLKGNVMVSETGLVDSTLLVVLHPANDDSAIFKKRPQYYTKIDGKGKFEFKYLPYKTFNVFVVPNDYTKKYDDSTKLFAFLNSPVQVTAKTDTQSLFAFQASKKIEKVKTVATKKTINAPIKYTKNLDGNSQDLLLPFRLSFTTPIHLNDSFPITLCDTLNKPIEGYTIQLDTTTHKELIITYPWKELTKFKCIIPKRSILDSMFNTIEKSDTISFITKAESAYGSVILRISGQEKFKHPVLLFTINDKVAYSYPITQSVINISKMLPGDFAVKLLEDENNNGKWDTGQYIKEKRQPEKVMLIDKQISIRADWENELNLVINK